MPAADFDYRKSAPVGSDEGRVTFVVYASTLFFFKNGENRYDYISAEIWFEDSWNLVSAQWDDELGLFLNRKLLDVTAAPYGYSPSRRTENSIYAGYKTKCCMTSAVTDTTLLVNSSFKDIKTTKKFLYSFE